MIKYANALKRLFPPGLAWNKNPVLDLFNRAFGTVLKQFDTKANDLLKERFTQSQDKSNEEWENQLGLDQGCGGISDDDAERKTAIKARRLEVGGQNLASYEALAIRFGLTIEIIKYPTMLANFAHVGEPVEGLPLVVTIKIIPPPLEEIIVGEYEVGSTGNNKKITEFMCQCRKKAPAYGQIYFMLDA